MEKCEEIVDRNCKKSIIAMENICLLTSRETEPFLWIPVQLTYIQRNNFHVDYIRIVEYSIKKLKCAANSKR